MKFTSKDIAHVPSLKNFLRTRVRTQKTKLIGDNLFNIYTTEEVKAELKKMIDRHSKGSNVAKYIPQWKSNIKVLEDMEAGK